MCGDILNADFAARLARAIPRVCDRVCDRALCVRACDRARDFTSLVSRSGAASPGGRLGASRQARQGRGSTPRGARARGSGLWCFAWCFAASGTGPLARVWWCVWRGVWRGSSGRSGTGLGRAPRGVSDRLWRGGVVWCGVPRRGVCGVVWCAETKMGHFAEKSMYQKRYKNGRLAAVFDAIFV